MTDWIPIKVAPRGPENIPGEKYLVASFPCGLVVSGTLETVGRADFTTSDGIYHAPTHWAVIDQPADDDPETEYPDWFAQAKSYEQAFMAVKDEYSELARAVGIRGASFFGDPLETHAEVVAHARRVLALLKDAELALQPFAKFSEAYPGARSAISAVVIQDPQHPVTFADMQAARSAAEAIRHFNKAIASQGGSAQG